MPVVGASEAYPICSMYSIFTYIWLIYGVNVSKYAIHGAYGYADHTSIDGTLPLFVTGTCLESAKTEAIYWMIPQVSIQLRHTFEWGSECCFAWKRRWVITKQQVVSAAFCISILQNNITQSEFLDVASFNSSIIIAASWRVDEMEWMEWMETTNQWWLEAPICSGIQMDPLLSFNNFSCFILLEGVQAHVSQA